jgi:mercuric ion transport protein
MLDPVVDYGNKLTSLEHVFAKESSLEKSLQEPAAFAAGRQAQSEKPASESLALTAGGIAALLTGTCCVVPLVLVSVGAGGAWLAQLRAFEPYKWVFIGAAVIALAFAWRRIYRPAAECKPGEVCAVPQVKRGYKIGFWAVALLLLFMAGFPYVAPLFY